MFQWNDPYTCTVNEENGRDILKLNHLFFIFPAIIVYTTCRHLLRILLSIHKSYLKKNKRSLQYWRTDLWPIEKWRKGAVCLCLEPHNVTRQLDPNFSFSLLYSTQLKVSIIDGIMLGYPWCTFYHMLEI